MKISPLFSTVGLATAFRQSFKWSSVPKSGQLRLFSQTLFDKIWNSHVVQDLGNNNCLLYIDRHLVHEVTSPQAFEGLIIAQRKARRPDKTLATVDHNIPTTVRKRSDDSASYIEDPESKAQVLALEQNVDRFGIEYFGLNDPRQGIVHIVGPEQGFTLPGLTIVCGDSHTATHGAFGALAFGIGTSEVEHVLATQTLMQSKAKNMKVEIKNSLKPGVTAKDVILHIISTVGTAGGTGHVIEFAGDAISALSMEGRMTICNMAIEAGAKAGLIAPDEITFLYLKSRPMCPAGPHFDVAVQHWRSLHSDPGAHFDKEVTIDATDISPSVTWGTSPQDVLPITGVVPDPACAPDFQRAAAMRRSLAYMDLTPGTALEGLKIDKVFIGSCTNARIEDLRAAAQVALGRTVAPHVHAMVVPGSGLVKAQAEAEGLDRIFLDAGFEWREPGCSMCLAMNPDKLLPGERCASTSNRNFEGRQGTGGRTHLLSPAMAAAAAVSGYLTDVRKLSLSPLPLIALSDTAPETHTTGPQAQKVKEWFTRDQAPIASPAGSASVAKDPNKVFQVHSGRAAVLDIQNVDTDMIIPKQFLKTIHRSGLGKALFHDLRYQFDGSEKSDFVLNSDDNRSASVLVVGANFGCGSSREHAPWALRDYGIRCIVSTSFADIFYNNCFKNGLLPVILSAEDVADIMKQVGNGKAQVTVDLPRQIVAVQDSGQEFQFEIEPFRKESLLSGMDEIGATLQHESAIAQFENRRAELEPWATNAV